MPHPTHMNRPTLLGSLLLAATLWTGGADAKPTLAGYDIVSYKSPAGYKLAESTPRLRKLNKVTGTTYCAVTLLAALPSVGTVQQDFDAEWALLGGQLTLGAPTSQPAPAIRGWQAVVGAGTFSQGSSSGLAMLTTLTGGSQRFSVLLLTNKLEACTGDYGKLVASLVLPPVKAAAAGAPAASMPPPAPTTPTAASPYRFTTTTFQEGWTSTQRPDWVEVTSGAFTVRLHYPIAFTDDTRRLDPTARVQHLWNQLIAPRYRATNLSIAPTELGVGVSSFGEADVTEVGTNRAAHVALLTTSQNGSAYVIEVVAPDVASLRKQFPTYDQIKAMAGFNKFQVDASDLRGTWENSSAAYGMYYSTADGSFAGMRGASVYDKFVFPGDGRYAWEAIGVVTGGGTGTAQVGTVKGTFRVNAWEATATDTDGKVTQYLLQFEAIRGGRLLVLQNKVASGLRYVLARTK